ncbi:ankyrin repeat protein [Cercophora scortea]|uniref:Ankyrin repeat protein n=1 Tax=Cercophora scortea TaxID=314031 RepID=A0AAE0IGU2_9PEZI|nr:ankyrin repeat protein [Cercophora scortea]
MDPITALSLLASLSELIRVSNGALSMVHRFKDGERELKDVSNDLAVFTESLTGCDRVLRSRHAKHGISPIVIRGAIDEGLVTIQDLQTHLQSINNDSSPTKRRLKWMQNRSYFKKLHDRFRDQIMMLQTFVSLAHTETFLAACSQNPWAMQEILNSADVEHAHETDPSPRSSISSSTTIFASESSTTSLCRLSSSETMASSVSSLDIPTREGSPLSSTACTPSEHTIPPAPVVRQACRFDCYCSCHARSLEKSPLKKKSREQDCSDPACSGAEAIAVDESVKTRFSKLRHGLAQVLSSRSIRVRYNLKTYRIISEGCDAIRYIKYGDIDNFKATLVSGDATLWDTAPDGWSLLHTATYNKQLPIVKYLLEHGVDTEEGDVGTRTPFDLAIMKSLAADATDVEKQIVEAFSHSNDYTSDFEFTPIHIAVLDLYEPTDTERPSLEQLIELLDDANNAPSGTDWDKWKLKYRKRSPLFSQILEYFRAAAYEMPKPHKVIHNLIDKQDKKFCWTPLHWASSAGLSAKMRVLLSHGADPFMLSNLGASILHAASESKSAAGLGVGLEICKRYPKRLDINQRNRWGETPLHVAAWDSLECVRLLLEAGADPNARQEDRQIPLHCAGLSSKSDERREIALLFCQCDGLEINTEDTDGRSPIFDFLNDPECIEILAMHGSHLDSTDGQGKSLLHHACIQGETGALETLLRLAPESATITAKDLSGNTPLLQALVHGNIQCALLLLELDDVGDMVGADGWAAVHHAAKLGHLGLLQAVLQHKDFKMGWMTDDGKSAEVIAMEAGNWQGEMKKLLRGCNMLS